MPASHKNTKNSRDWAMLVNGEGAQKKSFVTHNCTCFERKSEHETRRHQEQDQNFSELLKIAEFQNFKM